MAQKHKLSSLCLMLLSFLLLISCASSKSSKIKPNLSFDLKKISDAYWELAVSSSPTWATYIGDHRFDSQLADLSPKANQNFINQLKVLKKKLTQIDFNSLSNNDKTTYNALTYQFDSNIEQDICQSHLWVVDQLDGLQVTLPALATHHILMGNRDAINLAMRYNQIYEQIEQHIKNLQTGLIKGYTSPKVNIRKVISQIQRQLEVKPENSPYLTLNFSENFNLKNRETLKSELLFITKEKIYPSLEKYKRFLENIILPQARDKSGVINNPNGEQCYAALIKNHTGLKIPPNNIHDLGLAEVKRIKDRMELAVKKVYPNQSLSIFIQNLRQDPKQFLNSRQELISYNENLLKRAQMALNKAFFKSPRTEIAIKPIEKFREANAPAAYYYEATGEKNAKAYYYLNTHKVKSRPLYNMAALAFHEAVPGHHFQIATANENKKLPKFMRKLGHTAFVEGWALYAESLAGELGLYRTLEEQIGAYNYELWRALRLVIDTGLHAKNWSREKALQYLARETALPENEVENEIDRYIIWPGQALAYKIGQLTISDLRKEAKEKLRNKFSIKEFHQELLSHGALPLNAVKENMRNWLANKS